MYDYDLWAKTMLGVRAFDECGNRIKEDNKMDFQFNIGDYVETVDGRVGYIKSLRNPEEVSNTAWRYVWEDTNGKDNILFINYSKHYKRIGKYTFELKAEKKRRKMERLYLKPIYKNTKCETISINNEVYPASIKITEGFEDVVIGGTPPDSRTMMDKINEIIDYVNKREE